MDKRRHRRVKASGVAGHLRSETRAASCAVENLSAGGMFVRTAVAMPIGSPVLVDLVRPGLKKSIQVSGRVVNVVPAAGGERGHAPGLGIAFDWLPADVEQRLADLLAQLDVPAPTVRSREPEGLAPRTLTQQGLVTVDRWRAADPAVEPAGSTAVLPDNALLANVKGLFEELSRAQAELQARDEEIANLKAEIQRLRAERRRR